MSLSIAPLLLHSADLSHDVRHALERALVAEPEKRGVRLIEAASMLSREAQLECADARELVGLEPGEEC